MESVTENDYMNYRWGEDWVNYDGKDKIQKVTLISLLFIKKLGRLNAMTLINAQMKGNYLEYILKYYISKRLFRVSSIVI